MALIAADPAALDAARRQFFDEGGLPEGPLSRHIGQSWLRCRERTGTQLPGPEPIGRSALDLRRDSSRLLIHSALPELESLAEQMAHTRSVLILTDAQGLILEENGSRDFLRRAQRVALLPGVDWSEHQCGTNAIGTALVERQALEVRGAEHFLDAHKILSCAAAPILSSRGEVLGVLDVSGDASELHLHALALVKLAGQQIEHRLIHATAAGRHLLRFHAKAPMIGTPREAVFVIEDDHVVGANPIALQMLGLGWDEVLDQPLDRLFDRRWRALGEPRGALVTHGGLSLAGALERAERSTPRPAAAPAARHVATFEADATLAPLLQRAVRVLDAGSSVLLQGETGVGKDVFAGLLHRASARAGGPFVALNCAALPETLVEAELFGYAEGAFTGAQRKGQVGRVREADGGVLFLDEIGDMPLALQTRLLRVLQDRCVTPLGGGRSVPVDFALVCATHRDLAAMVHDGSFRTDLFYRLQDYVVSLPPLRERGDVPELIDRLFAQAGGERLGLRLTEAARAELASRSWPGNLRQLASLLRTLVALAEPGDRIDVERLPPDPLRPAGRAGATAPRTAAPSPVDVPLAESMPAPLRELTAEAIDRALAAHGGRVAAAARALGIHRSTVYRHLEQRRDGDAGP